MENKKDLVTLEEVTWDNLSQVLKLKVSSDQEKFVAPNSVSIAQGKYYEKSWFRAIYYKGKAAGFVMLEDDDEKFEYYLWRYMIDEKFQGEGIGRIALEKVIDYVKSRPNAKKLLTSCVPGKGSPSGFYQGLGFKATGQVDDGEDVYELLL